MKYPTSISHISFGFEVNLKAQTREKRHCPILASHRCGVRPFSTDPVRHHPLLAQRTSFSTDPVWHHSLLTQCDIILYWPSGHHSLQTQCDIILYWPSVTSFSTDPVDIILCWGSVTSFSSDPLDVILCWSSGHHSLLTLCGVCTASCPTYSQWIPGDECWWPQHGRPCPLRCMCVLVHACECVRVWF